MDDPAMLTIQQFARQSGLSETTVRRYIRSGKLPFNQPGGPRHRIMISADALPPPQASIARADPPGRAHAHQLPHGPKPRWMTQSIEKAQQ